jgi:hypothetical protein
MRTTVVRGLGFMRTEVYENWGCMMTGVVVV